MAINTRDRRHVALLDQAVIFPDVGAEDAQDRAWMLRSYYSALGAEAPGFLTGGGSIDDDLDADFFGAVGGAASEKSLVGWNVALNGRTYLIDVLRYQRTILDSNTPQTDDASEAGEKSLSRMGFWHREQTDWTEGAGQELFDVETSSRKRFLRSKGFDPWVRGQLCLHPDTSRKLVSSATNLDTFEVGGRLYIVDGQFLRNTTDPTLESPTFSSVDCDNTIIDVTTDGNRIFLAFGGVNVLKVVDVGGSTDSTLGAATPDIVQFANGRLIGADGKLLYEISSTGTTTTIRDDPRTGWAWKAIVGHPEAIFAAGTANDVSEFYAITPSATDTALTAPVFAGDLPRGETINVMAQYQGLVILGTSLGLRVATVTERKLSIGELIEVPGGVKSLDVFGRFCWFGWTNYDTISTGMGRADLSVVTSPDTFVPAYASDMMATTQGAVTGIARHNGRTYFAVSASGIWGESQYQAIRGDLEVGDIRYSVLADKIFTGVEIHHDALAGAVGATIRFADDFERSLGSNDANGSVVSVLDQAAGVGRSASLTITAFRDVADPTTGPCIRSWVLNSLPRPKRVTEIILPIVLKTKVRTLREVDEPQDPLEEVRLLDALASSNQLVVYQEGDATYQVRVSSVAIDEGGATSWSDSGDIWFQSTVLVRLLTKET